jgi:hypothetical protein
MHCGFSFAVATAATLAVLPTSAESSPALMELKLRLDREGPDAVNAYLDTETGWKEGKHLFRLATGCQVDAMRIVLRLMDSTNASATKGNSDVLELAMGRCPEQLLPMTPLTLVPQLCSVQAWSEFKPKLSTDSQKVAEIDRRTVRLRTNTVLARVAQRETCLEAYAKARICIQFPARAGC